MGVQRKVIKVKVSKWAVCVQLFHYLNNNELNRVGFICQT